MTTQSFIHLAEQLIRQTGARTTAMRVRVLECLLAQRVAVTHQQVEHDLAKRGPVDRVTVYRALEWLIDQGLAHKVLGDDRAWHFRANGEEESHHQHAHFRCNRCDEMICLKSASCAPILPALPAGYRGMEVELTIKGLCARCA